MEFKIEKKVEDTKTIPEVFTMKTFRDAEDTAGEIVTVVESTRDVTLERLERDKEQYQSNLERMQEEVDKIDLQIIEINKLTNPVIEIKEITK